MKNRLQLLLTLLLSSVILAVLASSASADSVSINFEGIVRAPDGTPAVGSVVVSSAGGQAVTDASGEFQLAAFVPNAAESVQITAVGQSNGQLVASKQVSVSGNFASISVGALHLAQSSTCAPSWLPTFGGEPGANGTIRAMTVFDDGSGAALYIGGNFSAAGRMEASRVAKWDGTSWKPVGSGVEGDIPIVAALTVFDDGNGKRLVAAGRLTTAGGVAANNIAQWDGSNWSALGSGLDNFVSAIAVFDDGTGAALYAGGSFGNAGGVPASNIAKWNGSSWSPVGGGLNNTVLALTVFDDGGGAALYVGGGFTTAGGVSVNRIARWDGTTWTGLGSGMDSWVYALRAFDDGTGAALYAGGLFTTAGGVTAHNIAKWNGSSWAEVGNAAFSMGSNNVIYSLEEYDDGSGPALYAGGSFTTAAGLAANHIAKWDGLSWSTLDSGVNTVVYALSAFDDGGGEALFVGGSFLRAGDLGVSRIARWNGSDWSEVGDGVTASIGALEVFDDGSGPALFVSGVFWGVGGVPGTEHIAKWDGSNWSALGSGLNSAARALKVFDDGTGAALYVGGVFQTAGGIPASNVAKWDGLNWTALGQGMNGGVEAFTEFNDGSGNVLIAAGAFTTAGGVEAKRFAFWNGSHWAPVGTAFGSNISGGSVSALTVYDDGIGPALFAGGSFTFVLSTKHVARWSGSTWHTVGGDTDGTVLTMTVFDDGSGPALFVGGRFTSAGGVTARNLAKWDGSNWSALSSDMTHPSGFTSVSHMIVFDDGTGSALYVGGVFTTVDGVVANNVAKYDGSDWAALDSGTNGGVSALTVFDDGDGPALFAGGSFSIVTDSGDSYLGKWGCQFGLTNNFCNGDGGDGLGCTDCPCGNNAPTVVGGTIGGCLNSAATSARLRASGSASVSLANFDTKDLRFSLTGAPPLAFCFLNSGDALAPTDATNACFGLDSGAQATAFDGLRCAVVNTRRHGGRSANASGDVGENGAGNPWGGEGSPAAGIAVTGAGFVAGQTRFFQVIHRDDPLAQCMRGLNTTQAVKVLFTP